MVRGIRKRVIGLSLLGVMVLSNVITPLMAFGLDYSNQLGTNVALGSPLLNEDFNYEDWDKWEMLTFGIFLSNMAVPLVDSYKTAFTVNTKGSAGAGRDALIFGSGNDSAANKALDAMLEYAVSNQAMSKGKEIRAIYTDYTADGQTEQEPKQATIKDLLIYPKDEVTMNWDVDLGSRLTDDGPIISKVNESVDVSYNSNSYGYSTYELYSLVEASLCRLVVDGVSGQDEIVFDWSNGWDAQMMGVWMASIINRDSYKIALENLEAMITANTPLFLDMFGNICGNLNGENIVIIPAASNCHIYKDGEKYNLVNSVILSESYTTASGASLVQGVEAYKWSTDGSEAGNPLKTDGGLKAGDTLIYFDSDYSYFNYINKNRTTIGSNIYTITSVNYGKELINLLNSRLDNSISSNTLGLRMEVIGGERVQDGEWDKIATWRGDNEKLANQVQNVIRSANMLSRMFPTDAGKETLAKLVTEKGDAPLFQSAVYIPVNIYTDDYEYKSVIRNVINDTFRYLDGSDAAASGKIDLPNSTSLRAELVQLDSYTDVANWIYFSDGKTNINTTGTNDRVGKLVKNSILGRNKKLFSLNKSYLTTLSNDIRWEDLKGSGIKLNVSGGLFGGNDDPERVVTTKVNINQAEWLPYETSCQRVIKVYTKNENMTSAMNVLNVVDGTEFALWTPRVYLTYLDWFGILDDNPQFNESLFDGSSDLLNTNAEELFKGTFLTAEEKEAQVLDYTYMMLHPTEGREYRADMMMNWFTDWIYRTYQSIVYGNSVSSYNENTGVTSQSSAGFLRMDSYQDNFMTSWFMEGYAKYAIVIIGVMLIGIVVVGVLNQKTGAWFLVSIGLLVNVILLTPMWGETTPYVVNNMVQSMFTSKMTYWAMSESIQNAKLESELSTSLKDGGSTSGLTVSDYVRMLNISYLDRAIMVRNDISKKVTEDSTGIIDEIQSLQSTRWLLPTLMRQFTASDGSANYVYQSIADVYDNWTNMYWVYNPEDKLSVKTANASTVEDYDKNSVPSLSVADKASRYEGYEEVDAEVMVNPDTSDDAEYLTYPWQSTSRLKDDEEVFHAGFYMIPGLLVADANGNWDEYASSLPVDATTFQEKAIEMEQEASTYDPTKKGATPNMGFLWMTENPGVYFYGVVKDTFGSDKTLASFSGDLQGYYRVSSLTGEEERQSFMHYQDTGLIRDFLDFEELFKNAIPYMYSVQILAGGTDGTNGVLGEAKMTNYDLYSENYKSWLFRSNWVTKLMEDKDLTRSSKIGLEDGSTVRVENPMLPESYEDAGREMVFSEAQMVSMGLSKADLSLVELKLLDVNKAVERDWTMLINYINTEDITLEVFYRQMATDALLEFNKEFSPDRLINGSKALYPTSLDLRSISFDSVMKMLMINSTRDSSYIYGDTMKGVIENSDIFSAVLMLISAFFCAYIIPFIRNIVLGLIFYIGLWAVICNILAGGITKFKITAAYAINNLVYMVATLVYYGIFALLINTSTADSVLSTSNIAIDAGPPTWQFFIIILASMAYIAVSVKLMSFTVKNYRDLGFEVYATWGNMLANKIGSKIKGIRDSISSGGVFSLFSGKGSKSNNRNKGNSGVSGGSEDSIDVESVNINNKSNKEDAMSDDIVAAGQSGYELDKVDDSVVKDNDNFFDKETEKGSHME